MLRARLLFGCFAFAWQSASPFFRVAFSRVAVFVSPIFLAFSRPCHCTDTCQQNSVSRARVSRVSISRDGPFFPSPVARLDLGSRNNHCAFHCGPVYPYIVTSISATFEQIPAYWRWLGRLGGQLGALLTTPSF